MGYPTVPDVAQPDFGFPYIGQESVACETQSTVTSDLGGMDHTTYHSSSQMSGPNNSSNGYDPAPFSLPRVSSHQLSVTGSTSTHEQPSSTYGQVCTWAQSSVDNNFNNYSYQHGEYQQSVPAGLSSPRTVWHTGVQEQISPSYTTTPPMTPGSFEPYSLDSGSIAPRSTIISSDYTKSPYDTASSIQDFAAPDNSRFSSPITPKLEDMDDISGSSHQASPSYTDGGLTLAATSSEREQSISPPAQGCVPRASVRRQGQKPGLSYAQLLQACFLSHQDHCMTLQEIYQWFRENTDKCKDDGSKGWQNSVRHNLSMNQAFIKKERHIQGPKGESKKPANVWMLAEWAARDGVQSTTRYRNQKHTAGNKNMSARVGGQLRNTAKRAVRDLTYRSQNTGRPGRYESYPQSYTPAVGHDMGFYRPPYTQYSIPRQPMAQMMYKASPAMPSSYQIPHSVQGTERIQSLADAATMAHGSYHTLHSQTISQGSNPIVQSPTPTRSDGDEPKTPNSVSDALPSLSPMMNPGQQHFSACSSYPPPMVEAYGVPSVITGVSVKDERFWMDPMDYSDEHIDSPW